MNEFVKQTELTRKLFENKKTASPYESSSKNITCAEAVHFSPSYWNQLQAKLFQRTKLLKTCLKLWIKLKWIVQKLLKMEKNCKFFRKVVESEVKYSLM